MLLSLSVKLPKGDERYMASQLSAALLETEPSLALPRLIRVLGSQNAAAQKSAATRLVNFWQGCVPAVPVLVELARRSELAGGFGAPSGHAFDILVAIGEPAQELIRLRVLPLIENDLDSERVWTRLHAADKGLRVFTSTHVRWTSLWPRLSTRVPFPCADPLEQSTDDQTRPRSPPESASMTSE
jgi:hypothetical protein